MIPGTSVTTRPWETLSHVTDGLVETFNHVTDGLVEMFNHVTWRCLTTSQTGWWRCLTTSQTGWWRCLTTTQVELNLHLLWSVLLSTFSITLQLRSAGTGELGQVREELGQVS